MWNSTHVSTFISWNNNFMKKERTNAENDLVRGKPEGMQRMCSTCLTKRPDRYFCFKCGILLPGATPRADGTFPANPWNLLTESETEFVELMIHELLLSGKVPNATKVTMSMRPSSRRKVPFLGYLHPIRQKFGISTFKNLEDFLLMMKSCKSGT
jgi:hypothetical protein